MFSDNQDVDNETPSTEDVAQTIVDNLVKSGYSLSDRVAISRQLRKVLRTEAEEAQKQLTTLIDSL